MIYKKLTYRVVSLIALVIMTIHLSFGQSAFSKNEIFIDGQIIDKENNEPVPFVHVLNLNSNEGTASNLQGRFSIKMKRADSLVFSALGFDKYIFALTEEVDATRLDITIEMNVNSMELEPVNIFAYRDERALKQAILDVEVKTGPEQQRMQLPGFYYGPRKEVKPSPITSPISFVYSKFSKEAKELKKYKMAQKEHDSWYNEVFSKYNPAIVQEITKLPKEEVDEFMRFCKIEQKFVRLSSAYEVVVAINECLEDYLKIEKVLLDN